MHKSVNIFLLSYYLDVIIECVNRISEYTKYPHKVIVGDNKSENSDKIRTNLEKLVENKKIHKAYFYDDNNSGNSIEHMLRDNDDSEFSIISDGDALLPNTPTCWLTDYVNLFDTYPNMGIIGFSSENLPIGKIMSNQWMKENKDITNNKFFILKPDEMPQSLLFYGHFMMAKTEFFIDFYDTKTFLSKDILFQSHAANKGLLRARYDKYSIINGSSEIMYKNRKHPYWDKRIGCRWGNKSSVGNFKVLGPN